MKISKALETERLFLTNISQEDRDFIFKLFTNDEINKYLYDAEPLTDISGADEIIYFYTQLEPKAQHRWVIVRKDGVKLGTCGFHGWNKPEASCDVGYELLPEFWGNGYMGEALSAIIDFARNEMKIKQINACIYIDNSNSIKLAEKLNFSFKGQMKDEIFRTCAYPHKIFTLDCTAV